MSWFGKMVGGTVGLMIGGPLGAIAGAAVGHHLFDKNQKERRPGRIDRDYGTTSRSSQAEERQATFFLALFSILGKVAKADGTVSKAEGDALIGFLNQMNIRGQERDFAIKVFNEAKNSRFTVRDFAGQFADATRGQDHLRSSLMDMLYRIAMADGELNRVEEEMIETVGGVLGFSSAEVTRLRQQFIGDAQQAYAVLGVSPDAPDDEIRSTYRRLVQEYHPDAVIGQGMPQEFVEYATRRFQDVQSAWETIQKTRKIR